MVGEDGERGMLNDRRTYTDDKVLREPVRLPSQQVMFLKGFLGGLGVSFRSFLSRFVNIGLEMSLN